MNAKEIEAQVEAALAANGITYKANGQKSEQTKPWAHDLWFVEFTPKSKAVFRTEFKTGLGHRKVPKGRNMYSWDGDRGNPRERARWEAANAKPVVPHVASVLHCLLLDAKAIDQSFDDWCGDFGYSTDSIKAASIYQECCNIGKTMRLLMPRELRAQLDTLLQDY